MTHLSQWCLLSIAVVMLALNVHASQAVLRNDGNRNEVKSAVFLSPKFVLGPGSVENKYYYNIDFPRGHIALKEFNAEVVDEAGNSVPLHETYLHHWVVVRYYSPKDAESPKAFSDMELRRSKIVMVRNSGICEATLEQYFGLGSETRRTNTYVPDPYGIEVGNPVEIPDEYEERWLLNVHAIDTRGVVDRLGCTECRCDLYNVTEDEYGHPLVLDYTGGLYCCYDQTQCRLRQGVGSVKRSLYLRYTVKWVDWEHTIVPVKIYIFDVTDTGERGKHSTGLQRTLHGCKVEYDVESCGTADVASSGCIDNKKARMVIPHGGNVIYGVAHQHSGGVGSALYGEDGRLICSSIPVYGEDKEAGNEAGYIVGMSTCYPQPGSVKLSDGETLTLESNYSSNQKHTGVMGLFYILVADIPPKPMPVFRAAVHKIYKHPWAFVSMGVGVVAVASVIGVGYRKRNENDEGYQPMGI